VNDISIWEDYIQQVSLISESSQWATVGVGTGFYEPRDSVFDLVLELAPPAESQTWYTDADADDWGLARARRPP
jgi:hypothetical protein